LSSPGPQLVNCPVAHPDLPQLRTTIPPTANLSSSAKDEMRSSSSGTQISTCSAACRTSDRLCTRRANCSGAELLGVRWRTSGEDFPPEGRSKRKRLLRRDLKKGVGHPAAIEAAGRPGCSAPATLAPAAGRFPRTITAQACRQASFGRRPEAAPNAFGPADNLEDLGDVAPTSSLW